MEIFGLLQPSLAEAEFVLRSKEAFFTSVETDQLPVVTVFMTRHQDGCLALAENLTPLQIEVRTGVIGGFIFILSAAKFMQRNRRDSSLNWDRPAGSEEGGLRLSDSPRARCCFHSPNAHRNEHDCGDKRRQTNHATIGHVETCLFEKNKTKTARFVYFRLKGVCHGSVSRVMYLTRTSTLVNSTRIHYKGHAH